MRLLSRKLAARIGGLGLIAAAVCGCDSTSILDASAAQLEASLVTLIETLSTQVIYNFLGLTSPFGF